MHLLKFSPTESRVFNCNLKSIMMFGSNNSHSKTATYEKFERYSVKTRFQKKS